MESNALSATPTKQESVDESEFGAESDDSLSDSQLCLQRVSIISYGHTNGPLTIDSSPSTTKLTFSVRDVPNPLAKLRQKHTGLSARLRHEVLASNVASERLTSIADAVNAKMHELEGSEDSQVAQHQVAAASPAQLVVGICCEEGKHRSVSFATELARRIKRKGWAVEVIHRDLNIGNEDDGKYRESSGGIGRKKVSKRERQQERQERRKGRWAGNSQVADEMWNEH
jgi:RNase adaptor protein for sRNA GlmZ degradation